MYTYIFTYIHIFIYTLIIKHEVSLYVSGLSQFVVDGCLFVCVFECVCVWVSN